MHRSRTPPRCLLHFRSEDAGWGAEGGASLSGRIVTVVRGIATHVSSVLAEAGSGRASLRDDAASPMEPSSGRPDFRSGTHALSPPFLVYSLSFDFAELRFCYVALHSSREAAADARSSRGEAGRCA